MPTWTATSAGSPRPRRRSARGHDGLLPVPGASDDYEWQGFLPVNELPQSFNPPEHWLATANHNILPKGYPHPIAYEWAAPHRFLRIRERLTAQKQFTLDDFQSIQHESTSLPGQALGQIAERRRSSRGARAAEQSCWPTGTACCRRVARPGRCTPSGCRS